MKSHTKEDLMALGLTEKEAMMLLTPVKNIPKDHRGTVVEIADRLANVLIPIANKAYVKETYDKIADPQEREQYRILNSSYFE